MVTFLPFRLYSSKFILIVKEYDEAEFLKKNLLENKLLWFNSRQF